MSFLSSLISSIEKEDLGAGGGVLASAAAAVVPVLAHASSATSEVGLAAGAVGLLGTVGVWILGKVGIKKATIVADVTKAKNALPELEAENAKLVASIPQLGDIEKALDTKAASLKADVLNSVQGIVNDAIAKSPAVLQPDEKTLENIVKNVLANVIGKVTPTPAPTPAPAPATPPAAS